MSSRKERAIQALERVIDLRKQLNDLPKQLREAEAELDTLIEPKPSKPSRGNGQMKERVASPIRQRSQRVASTRAGASFPNRRKPQSGLSTALRRVLRGDAEREFTIDEMMGMANIDQTRRPSVHAALSRMVAAKKIAKGLKPGAYRAIRKEERA